ncbi:MAG TPA: radical SAM protein [Elusimicrobiales bacterium]|nr:radical SAM protein [Elusimicrobiales bacterium]
MKKTALIYPSVSLEDDYSTGKSHEEIMPPLWALALAGSLRAAAPRARVEIVDQQVMGRRPFLEKLSSSRYELAGLSPVAHTYKRNLECARLLKKNGALVVLGGHYAPTLAREILANRGPGSADYCVDAIVRYDGEKAFRELAAGKPFKSISNLVYPGAGGKLVENPVESLDLASLPPVDYTLVDLKKYFRLQRPPAHTCRTLPFVAQRGCRLARAGRCVFCSIQSSGGYRSLPPAEAARRMARLASEFGVGYIYEGSDDFIADPAWLKEFAATVAADKLIMPILHVFVRPAIVSRKNLAVLKSVNARYLNLGIESMSAAILRGLSKGATVEINHRAVALTLEAGLVPNINLIMGLPGESRATLSETFSELKKMQLPLEASRRVSLPTLAVFPGTEVWRRLLTKEPKYRGLDVLNYDESYSDWLKHFCDVSLEDVRAAKAAMEKFFTVRMARLERK